MGASISGLGRIGVRGESGPHPVFESLACVTCPARKSDICGGLDNLEIRDLAAGSNRIQLKAGETLIWDGDVAQNTYVVTRGTLRAAKASDDGRRQILDFLFAGQFIGIPSGATYQFNVEALTEAEVCRFDRRKLEELMAKHPAVDKGYRSGTARQLESAYDHAYALGRRTAMERVAAFLLDLQASACPKSTVGTLKLPMTRTDIADFLGLTLETVSRAFSRIKTLGVIRLPSAQEVEIKDPERLKALAGTGGL
ncbi:MAG: helix-turn-helix domain-containing protein [Alphaproteobacteria bacterium]|nr:helix-turn-helix domain-containing protein [Alphaproteobacteria bacterium]